MISSNCKKHQACMKMFKSGSILKSTCYKFKSLKGRIRSIQSGTIFCTKSYEWHSLQHMINIPIRKRRIYMFMDIFYIIPIAKTPLCRRLHNIESNLMNCKRYSSQYIVSMINRSIRRNQAHSMCTDLYSCRWDNLFIRMDYRFRFPSKNQFDSPCILNMIKDILCMMLHCRLHI